MYTSYPPLGKRKVVAAFRQPVVVKRDPDRRGNLLQPYLRTGDTFSRMDQTLAVSGLPAIKDLAAGNLLGARPDAIAITMEGKTNNEVQVVTPTGQSISINIGFHPIAVAAGDLTGDGTDKLIALGEDGSTATCNAATQVCHFHNLIGVKGIDVAVADMDGDGVEEAIFLVDVGGRSQIRVWKLDAQEASSHDLERAFQQITGDLSTTPANGDNQNLWGLVRQWKSIQFDHFASLHLKRLSAGDLNGDGKAEIAALEEDSNGGFPFLASTNPNTLHIFQVINDIHSGGIQSSNGSYQIQEVGSQKFSAHAYNLEIQDTDGDGYHELMLLNDDSTLESWGVTTKAVAQASPTSSAIVLRKLSSTKVPEAIGQSPFTMADTLGTSVWGELEPGVQPTLVPGKVLPVVVVGLPPYSEQFSQGKSNVWFGHSDSGSEFDGRIVDTNFGTSAKLLLPKPSSFFQIPGGLDLKPNDLGFELTRGVGRVHIQTVSKDAGRGFSMTADPGSNGPDYANIVLTCGCFHRYNYRISDPTNITNQDGGHMSIFQPVDAQYILETTKRYNAFAKEIDIGLPIINVRYRVGEVDSYPKKLEDLNGHPVLPQDILYTTNRLIDASPSGLVDWSLKFSNLDETKQRITWTNQASVGPGLGLPGLADGLGIGTGFNASVSNSHETGFQLVSTDGFSGNIPPIRFSPTSPNDRWSLHHYSFAPHVIKQYWKDGAGNDMAFYVVTYTVSNPSN